MVDRQEVLNALRQIVKASVNTPTTVVFCDEDELEIQALSSDEIRVKGYFSAENTYGAMIKTPFDYRLIRSLSGRWMKTSGSMGDPHMVDRQEVLNALRPIVKASVNTPTTVVFCDEDELEIQALSSDEIRVKGYFSAQNTYGAMIKTPFDYKLTRSPSGRWMKTSGSMGDPAKKTVAIIWIVLMMIGCSLLSYWMTFNAFS